MPQEPVAGHENFEKLARFGFKQMGSPDWIFHRSLRMCFEYSAVRDADEKWLDECLTETVPPNDFVFYFKPANVASRKCEEQLARMDLAQSRADIRFIKVKGPKSALEVIS